MSDETKRDLPKENPVSNAETGYFRCRSRLLRGFRGFNETGEGLRIDDRDLGEHLAVDLDAGFLQAAHEDAVADAIETASGVDALDPKLAVIPLDQTAGIVRIAKRMANLLFRGFEKKVLASEIAGRGLQDLFTTGTGNGATFDSSHGSFFLLIT